MKEKKTMNINKTRTVNYKRQYQLPLILRLANKNERRPKTMTFIWSTVVSRSIYRNFVRTFRKFECSKNGTASLTAKYRTKLHTWNFTYINDFSTVLRTNKWYYLHSYCTHVTVFHCQARPASFKFFKMQEKLVVVMYC